MPRRAASKETDPNVERRVTRRSLRGADEPPATPPKTEVAATSASRSRSRGGQTARKASPSPSPRGRGRGKGSRSGSRRGRGAAEEEPEDDVEEETMVDEAAKDTEEDTGADTAASQESATENEASTAPPSRRGRKSGTTKAVRGRQRGVRKAASEPQVAEAAEAEQEEITPVVDESPRRSRSTRIAAQSPPKQEMPTRRSQRGRSSVTPSAEAEEPKDKSEEAVDTGSEMNTEETSTDPENKKRKREEVEEGDAEKMDKKQKQEEKVEKEMDTAMETEETDKGAGKVVDSGAANPETAKKESEKETTKVTEQIKESEPVKTIESIKVTEPVKEPETGKESEPVKEPEPVKKPEPVKEPEPVKDPEPVPVKEPESGGDSNALPVQAPTAEAMEEMKEPEPASETESAKQQDAAAPAAEPMETEDEPVSESTPQQDVLADYVVVNMEDVPASDSAEVEQAKPMQSNSVPTKPAASSEPDNQPPPVQKAAQDASLPQQTVDNASLVSQVDGSSRGPQAGTPSNHLPTTITNSNGTESGNPLFDRHFVSNPHLDSSSLVEPNAKFSLVSYNILADCHSKGDKYSWISQQDLSISCRHKKLLPELQYLDADIICLQEVSPQYFTEVLQPDLKSLGYEGVFMKRISEDNDEGEATFFRTRRFTMVTHRGVALRDLAFKELEELESSGLEAEKAAAVKKFIDRPAVVLVTQFRCNNTGATLTVGNIHVSWDYLKKQDLKCIQVASAVREVVAVADGPNNAHIVCGDFNAWPETAVYQLSKEGYLNDASMAALQASTDVEMTDGSKQALVNLWWKGFQHTSTSMRSAYATCMGVEPVTTRYPGSGMCKNVDYVWLGGSSLEVAGVLKPVSEQLIVDGIPNKTCPSDHLSLKAQLFFK